MKQSNTTTYWVRALTLSPTINLVIHHQRKKEGKERKERKKQSMS